MKNFLNALLVSLLFITASYGQFDFQEPVTWKTSIEKINELEYYLVFEAKIDNKWHLYSQFSDEKGSGRLEIESEQADSLFTFEGKALESEVHKEYNETFKVTETFFENQAVLKQKIKLLKEVNKLEVSVYGQVCKEVCILLNETFTFSLDEALPLGTTLMKNETVVKTVVKKEIKSKKKDKGLLSLFLFSFLGGLAALFTPCVFPMIPMTVSFFTKQSKTKAAGIKNAVVYGLAIIALYVILGTVVTAIFGADALNALSTDPWFNIVFFFILIIFAASFLGAFEIMLPNSWANKVDRQADRGGMLGIFFMALALAIVSFSCTGPIVGTALVAAAGKGGVAPIISMLGFSSAIALPFTLFAMFPGWLNSLPKSGGWLNTVKVVLGFLELALAFKFLSHADLVLDLHWLEREMFLAIWIVVFGALGFYLFGKIQLPHDSPTTKISVGRLFLGLLTFTFVIYLIPGLWGAPLKLISGFPPPLKYSESPYGVGFTKKIASSSGFIKESLPKGAEYGPHDIVAFKDYEEGMAYAKKVGKPVFLDFTGKACVNCRKMEEKVWSETKVLQVLRNDIVLISLYVDYRKPLPKREQYISKVTGKKVKTVGNKWSDFQMEKYQTNAQPYYVILDNNGNDLSSPTAYTPDANEYYEWLVNGIDKYSK
ncbi:thioredoxin family protein [Flavobacteriaceae bacterium]|nr:thioredoxin family protein [Flavobacteriaceae bacterium]